MRNEVECLCNPDIANTWIMERYAITTQTRKVVLTRWRN